MNPAQITYQAFPLVIAPEHLKCANIVAIYDDGTRQVWALHRVTGDVYPSVIELAAERLREKILFRIANPNSPRTDSKIASDAHYARVRQNTGGTPDH